MSILESYDFAMNFAAVGSVDAIGGKLIYEFFFAMFETKSGFGKLK
jgi:hypothetical protein